MVDVTQSGSPPHLLSEDFSGQACLVSLLRIWCGLRLLQLKCNWTNNQKRRLSSYYQAKKYCDVGSNSWRRKSEKLPQIDLDNFQMWTIFPQPSNNLFFFTKGGFSSAMISDKKEELSVLWHLVSVFVAKLTVASCKNEISFPLKWNLIFSVSDLFWFARQPTYMFVWSREAKKG